MPRPTVMRALAFVGFTTLFPLLVVGCPKKEPPVVIEEAGPPPPPPASTPTVTELVPLGDDAGPDAADATADAAKKWTGGGPSTYSANQLRIKECCNALHAQAKQLGSAPEAAEVNMAAATCDMLVAQAGATGTAPELNGLRQMLKSVKLPSVCQQ
jgi:hypothetical protein